MKGLETFRILEAVGGAIVDFAALFEAILSAGYGASAGKMQYEMSRLRKERNGKISHQQAKDRIRQRFYVMIAKLKQDGLLDQKIKHEKRVFSLTRRGKTKLIDLKMRFNKKLPDVAYPREIDEKFIIVAFDIPETDRRKRDWLRYVLRGLGFSMIQKSVWIGKTKIPEKLLGDLSKLRLLDHIEIFEISKAGSLKHVV
jgi:DNA-binding transcriptional regulator PaaX